MRHDTRLRIICGPTAAGKSAIALELAADHGGEIISADSRQVYRGFDIGTGKPTPGERARVPHRGIDTADPAERYSAARWAREATAWIGDASAAGRTPLVVGGTGLYIRALVNPLADAPALDPARRAALADHLQAKPMHELRRWCAELDEPRSSLGRTQLLRSVETALLAGKRLSEVHTQSLAAAGTPRFSRAHYLVVDPGESLAQRIADRVRNMFDAGWIDEVRELESRIPPDAPAWKSAGYSAVRALTAGRLDLSSAMEQVIIETRQYAKRQRTWFRHQLPADTVTRLDPGGSDAHARAALREWWEKSE